MIIGTLFKRNLTPFSCLPLVRETVLPLVHDLVYSMFIDIDHTLNIYRVSWSICKHCDVVDLQEIQSTPWQQEYTSRTVNIGEHHGGDLFPFLWIVGLQWKVSKAIRMVNDAFISQHGYRTN